MSITFTAYTEPTIDRGVLEVPESVELNVSNVNGRFLLVALGLASDEADTDSIVGDPGDDLWGQVDPSDFLGRVLLAQAINPADAGMPAHVVPGSGPRWVDCGRREGYLGEKLTVLHALAEWAVTNNCDYVAWA